MGSFQCRADRARNRLYIRLVGFFRGRDVEPSLQALESALAELQPDFDVVTDLSEFVPGSPAAAEALRLGGELIKDKGRRRAVRITGGLMAGLMQFRRLLQSVFDETTVRYAKSTAEADSILDSWTDEQEPDR